ncbi:AlpA family transcriptional regulator [Chromobacterium sp. IIBBL 290-4]|uniref:helix-turn-helix transcriptional regulator n=1 Tax=Chromobacterium sp. IIBBL 290-4 TaxID=2953890 RepID=UPI0020B880F5|nr:AlpA family phage regulatory protein [Chromobacterium sp. IIBBL 290-4]UTH73315.1 AlpA family phage regulatory protein [Chromobacterium sp. IIBBL 290-4]
MNLKNVTAPIQNKTNRPWHGKGPVKGDRYLRRDVVLERVGVTKTTLYTWMASDDFPPSIALGGGSVGFLESHIEMWIAWRFACAGLRGDAA